MVLYASADQIARAIVAAARLTGADPLTIFDPSPAHVAGTPIVRARYLALAGLRSAFPQVGRNATARCVGLRGIAANNAWKIMKSAWWREDWVDEVVGAILAPEAEAGDVVAPSSDPSGHLLPQGEKGSATSSEEKLRRYYRPARKPKRSAARALDFGEPAPGRSALDKRRAGVADDHVEPDEDEPGDRSRRYKSMISLPRLKFLEKDF